jgi:hypothetical protein
VHVHVGHSREQIAPASVDARCALRGRCRVARADLDNLVVAHDDTGVADHALGVHRDHVDVLDHDRRRLRAATRVGRACRGQEADDSGSEEPGTAVASRQGVALLGDLKERKAHRDAIQGGARPPVRI